MSTSIISMTNYLHIYFSILIYSLCSCIDAFIIPSHKQNNMHIHTKHRQQYNDATTTSYTPKQYQSTQSTSSTSLNVWWFGGTPDASETSTSGKECEFVFLWSIVICSLIICSLIVNNSPWSALFR